MSGKRYPEEFKIEPVSLTLWTQLPGIALSLIVIDELHKARHNWKLAI